MSSQVPFSSGPPVRFGVKRDTVSILKHAASPFVFLLLAATVTLLGEQLDGLIFTVGAILMAGVTWWFTPLALELWPDRIRIVRGWARRYDIPLISVADVAPAPRINHSTWSGFKKSLKIDYSFVTAMEGRVIITRKTSETPLILSPGNPAEFIEAVRKESASNVARTTDSGGLGLTKEPWYRRGNWIYSALVASVAVITFLGTGLWGFNDSTSAEI
jgi:hypothetical protein